MKKAKTYTVDGMDLTPMETEIGWQVQWAIPFGREDLRARWRRFFRRNCDEILRKVPVCHSREKAQSLCREFVRKEEERIAKKKAKEECDV